MPKADETPTNLNLDDRRLSAWERMLQTTGARLCYGEPVKDGDRTVIPVASIEAAGGGGWGRASMGADAEAPGAAGEPGGEGEGGTGQGGGLGGWVSAVPVGFIEIGPEGTRFKRIIEPVALARGMAAAAVKGVVVLARQRRRRR